MGTTIIKCRRVRVRHNFDEYREKRSGKKFLSIFKELLIIIFLNLKLFWEFTKELHEYHNIAVPVLYENIKIEGILVILYL